MYGAAAGVAVSVAGVGLWVWYAQGQHRQDLYIDVRGLPASLAARGMTEASLTQELRYACARSVEGARQFDGGDAFLRAYPLRFHAGSAYGGIPMHLRRLAGIVPGRAYAYVLETDSAYSLHLISGARRDSLSIPLHRSPVITDSILALAARHLITAAHPLWRVWLLRHGGGSRIDLLSACDALLRQDLDPDQHAWAHLLRGDALQALGKETVALAAYARATRLPVPTPWLRQAAIHARAGRYATADSLYGIARRKRRYRTEVLLAQAATLETRQQYDAASDIYAQLLRIDPRCVPCLTQWARLLTQMDLRASAREKYEMALELDPGNSSLIRAYGAFLWEEALDLDADGKAIAALERYLQVWKIGYDVEGIVLAVDRWTRPESSRRDSLPPDLRHDLNTLLIERAASLRQGGRGDLAETLLERASLLVPDDPRIAAARRDVWLKALSDSLRNGTPGRTLGLIRRLRTLMPETWDQHRTELALEVRQRLDQTTSDPEGRITCYALLDELGHCQPVELLRWADLLQTQRRYAEANLLYARLYQMNTDLPAVLLAWATSLAQAGEPARAEEKLALAHQIDPRHAVVLQAWGDLLLADNRTPEAIVRWEKSLALLDSSLADKAHYWEAAGQLHARLGYGRQLLGDVVRQEQHYKQALRLADHLLAATDSPAHPASGYLLQATVAGYQRRGDDMQRLLREALTWGLPSSQVPSGQEPFSRYPIQTGAALGGQP
ncbi:MAG: hypothetical protein OHK0039_13840 [Bacteroidia bacterium]